MSDATKDSLECCWCGYTVNLADCDTMSVHILKQHNGKLPLLIHKMALDYHDQKTKELKQYA